MQHSSKHANDRDLNVINAPVIFNAAFVDALMLHVLVIMLTKPKGRGDLVMKIGMLRGRCERNGCLYWRANKEKGLRYSNKIAS